MRSGRPLFLAELERDRMHRVTGDSAARTKAARSVLRQARDFRRAASTSVTEELFLPAVSALQESARLAVTAVAAFNGWRFSNTAGSHESVIDYGYAVQLVDRQQFAQLDQLRELRHQVNYPADLIAPTANEVAQFAGLVDLVIEAVIQRIPAPRIPPPPT